MVSVTMRVLHCPVNTAGIPWTLSRAERRLGIQSDVMVYQTDWLGFPCDIDLQLGKKRRIAYDWAVLNFFLKALGKYDVFHMHFGSSIFPSNRYPWPFESDLPFLNLFHKKIVASYHGCDVRQRGVFKRRFPISACSNPECVPDFCNEATDARKRKMIAYFARHAQKLFAVTPDLMHVLPPDAEFLPSASVDIENWTPCDRRNQGKKIKIIHSPTNRAAKGTRYIIEAVEKLRVKYPEVELTLVEGVPHDQVRKIYEDADLAIDQLLCGWYGVFAVEMMALGKPVVCYVREEDLAFIPNDMRHDLPIINASPDSVYNVLLNLMQNRERLPLVGEKSRAYVARWHDPGKIASRVKEVYESLG